MRFDLSTDEGLGSACREAERHLDPESIVKNAGFLEQVSTTPEAQRDSERFLHLVWDNNPLFELGSNPPRFYVKDGLADPDFPSRFKELATDRLPEDSADRAVQLDGVYDRMLNLLKPLMRRSGKGKQPRPKFHTTRTFAALFPNEFTALINPRHRCNILKSMGDEDWTVNRSRKFPAQANRRIIERLDEALGAVDRSDWNAVAQRMMLPEVIFRAWFCNKAHRTPLPVPPSSRCRRLTRDRWTESRSTSSRSATTANWCSMTKWARRSTSVFGRTISGGHFGVLTGLSGTGKTQLALRYAEALTGAIGESNEQVCTIPVQPGWYDPTPLLGYVNPLGEGRYIQRSF